MTAATCASVASCDDRDRPVARLAAVPVDDLAHDLLVDARHLGEQPASCGRGPGVLADDRDDERVAVLDQHAAVAVEEHAARRAQRAACRWWLFSAISRNFSCCTTWKNQNASASTTKTTITAVLDDDQPAERASAGRRGAIRRRSDAGSPNMICSCGD